MLAVRNDLRLDFGQLVTLAVGTGATIWGLQEELRASGPKSWMILVVGGGAMLLAWLSGRGSKTVKDPQDLHVVKDGDTDNGGPDNGVPWTVWFSAAILVAALTLTIRGVDDPWSLMWVAVVFAIIGVLRRLGLPPLIFFEQWFLRVLAVVGPVRVVLGGVAIPAGFIGLNRLSNDGDNTQAFVVLGVAVVLFVLFAAPNT